MLIVPLSCNDDSIWLNLSMKFMVNEDSILLKRPLIEHAIWIVVSILIVLSEVDGRKLKNVTRLMHLLST
jgi:hypothetical protein